MSPQGCETVGESENDIKVFTTKEVSLKDRKKRRSKSGCRTCRKRRVKCDEGRPICANCIKSKRSCEGYAPLFSFIYPRYPTATPAFSITSSSQNTTYTRPVGRNSLPSNPLPLIRPRPREFRHSDSQYSSDQQLMMPGGRPENGRNIANHEQPLFVDAPPQHSQIARLVTLSAVGRSSQSEASASPRPSPTLSSTLNTHVESSATGSYGFNRKSIEKEAQTAPHRTLCPGYGADLYQASSSQFPTPSDQDIIVSDKGPPLGGNSEPLDVDATNADHESMSFEYSAPLANPSMAHSNPLHNLNIAQILEDAAVEIQDDDYFDVSSDEEDETLSMYEATQRQTSQSLRHRTTPITTAERSNEHPKSRMTKALEPYCPDLTANPLRNPETTFVFTHFIVSTAPTLSLHNRNLPMLISETRLTNPSYPQLKLWTEAIPNLALHNSSLLHAILAVSSLQLARVYKTAATPSLKHYAYSLKRVHHSVSHERKRHEVATLAATLLLAHYEVMQADHLKWSTHLHGAAQLLDEYDHAGIEARIQDLTALHANEIGDPTVIRNVRPSSSASPNKDPKETWSLRRSQIESIAGFQYTESDRQSDSSKHLPSMPNNLQDLRVLQDLCWWYRRQGLETLQDIMNNPINSLLARCLLFLNKWQCAFTEVLQVVQLPSKGDFRQCHQFTDRARKLKLLENNGGIWPIPQSLDILPGDGRWNDRQPFNGDNRHGPSIPLPNLSFYGMAPTTGNTRMPRAFEVQKPKLPSEPQPSAVPDDIDLETAAFEAERGWREIHRAFLLFAKALHSGFSPLESSGALDGAFGPTASYASYAIAELWMQYYMGLIILTRSHPSMPPAAQIAVGVAAPQTSAWANNIGRIAAGLLPDGMRTDLPDWHAALMTCTLPLFFAGVQYQDELQRMWTIRRLRDAEAATGWASAGLCAHGCESAWVAASQAGRGPPYQRSFRDNSSEDQRISGKYSHLTGMPPTDPLDRRFIPYDARTRLVWAVGILGTEEDFSKMSLNEGK